MKVTTDNGFRIGWNGEVFVFGFKRGTRWWYQPLCMDIRGMGDQSRASVRKALAHLVKELRKSGKAPSLREYRFASGSRRRRLA